MRTLILFFTGLLLASQVQALQIDRVTTVSDDQGGTLTISSQGSAHADGGGSSASLIANAFSPRGEGQISADLQRERSRTAEDLTATYNGTATVSGTDADGTPVTIDIELIDVTVTREGQGPELSGSVIVNGTAYDASELPARARAALARLLRLFGFA